MTSIAANPLQAFRWEPHPEAERLVRQLLDDLLAQSEFATLLRRRMLEETGTRLFDWIDHLAVPTSAELLSSLSDAGFRERPAGSSQPCYVHEGALFPRILVSAEPSKRLAIKVESVVDFLAAWPSLGAATIQGSPRAPFRTVRLDASSGAEVCAVERHGWPGFDVSELSAHESAAVLLHEEALRLRRRNFSSDEEGFAETNRLVTATIADVGRDRACDLFFAAERAYWQRRNRAAQVQFARQNRLGLGWANHDHHTYRSSREHFAALIAVLETLGFECRERFYAGAESGWGAQVLEQPRAGVVVFADVDLSPDELADDFAHHGLPPRHELGTVGLWCALHGEAMLQAGMHHLECQFDFGAVREQLQNEHALRVMRPFTDFAYLRQAFTEGEIWTPLPHRIEQLLDRGQITEAQARQFREKGALGSHLETLERNQGFKGFNQTGVSEIIARTDPRRAS